MSRQNKVIKVLISKLGLDSHDKGAKIVARACRDAGMEVVYLGVGHSTVEQIAQAVIQEDADVVGFSFLSGGHLNWCRKMMPHLKDRTVIVGGVISKEDIRLLKEIGVAEVFPTGTPTSEIVSFLTLAQKSG